MSDPPRPPELGPTAALGSDDPKDELRAASDLTGRRVGAYRVERLIRRGGMGAVYLASRDDGEFEKHVAVKVVRPSLASPERLRRFRKERQILAELEHPSIARLIDGGTTAEGMPYFVMEYVPGDTLADVLGRGPMPLDDALRLGRTIANVLDALHGAGLVLRDLTPSNVMITPTGEAKVLDFGIAKEVSELAGDAATRDTHPGTVIGSPAYMSPEQAVGEDVDAASDIFSFGVLLHQALTGELPFDGTTRGTYARNLLREPPRRLPAGVPKSVRQIVQRCLQKEPSDRFASAAALQAALEDASGLATGSGPVAAAERAEHHRVSTLTLAVAAAGILVLAYLLWPETLGDAPDATFPAAALPVATSAWAESSPRISPDGRFVSYVSDQGGARRIWLQADSGAAEPLDTTGGQVDDHVWSPDGRRIAYLTRTPDAVILHVVGPSGAPTAEAYRLDLTSADLVRWVDGGIYLLAQGSLWRFDLEGQYLSEVTNRRGTLYLLSADVSADETRVAFTALIDGIAALWVAGPDGSEARQLTYERIVPRSVAWRGARAEEIVYVSSEGGQVDVWEMHVASGNRRRITFSTTPESEPEASRDGRRLVFGVSDQNADLASIDPSGPSAAPARLTSDSLSDLFPSVSADGSSVAFQRSRLRDAGGGATEGTVLVARDFFRGPLETVGGGVSPTISSDGRYVAYLIRRTPNLSTLWLHDTLEGNARELSGDYYRGGLNPFPLGWTSTGRVWSQSGPELYFVVREADDAYGVIRARIGSAAGPELDTVVSVSEGRSLRGIALAPEGHRLAYLVMSERELRWELRVAEIAAGAENIELAEPLGAELTLVGWTSTGQLVVVRAASRMLTEPVEVLVGTAAGGWRTAGEVLPFEPGSLTLDGSRDALYFVRAENGLHNLYSFSLDEGTERVVVAGASPSETISGTRVRSDGRLVFSIQERNRDVWSIDLER